MTSLWQSPPLPAHPPVPLSPPGALSCDLGPTHGGSVLFHVISAHLGPMGENGVLLYCECMFCGGVGWASSVCPGFVTLSPWCCSALPSYGWCRAPPAAATAVRGVSGQRVSHEGARGVRSGVVAPTRWGRGSPSRACRTAFCGGWGVHRHGGDPGDARSSVRPDPTRAGERRSDPPRFSPLRGVRTTWWPRGFPACALPLRRCIHLHQVSEPGATVSDTVACVLVPLRAQCQLCWWWARGTSMQRLYRRELISEPP